MTVSAWPVFEDEGCTAFRVIAEIVVAVIKEPRTRSTIRSRGQIVIPAEVRRRFRLALADRLEWIVEPLGIRVVLVRADHVEAFRGPGSGGLIQ